MHLINAEQVTDDGEAVDTTPLLEMGIPTMVNFVKDTEEGDYYFAYHHSAGDTMSIMDADDLDGNVLGIAAMFYMLADLNKTIPKPNLNKTIPKPNLKV